MNIYPAYDHRRKIFFIKKRFIYPVPDQFPHRPLVPSYPPPLITKTILPQNPQLRTAHPQIPQFRPTYPPPSIFHFNPSCPPPTPFIPFFNPSVPPPPIPHLSPSYPTNPNPKITSSSNTRVNTLCPTGEAENINVKKGIYSKNVSVMLSRIFFPITPSGGSQNYELVTKVMPIFTLKSNLNPSLLQGHVLV